MPASSTTSASNVTPTIGSQTCRREDTRLDHEFVDMLSTDDQVRLFDMTLLHETRLAGEARHGA